MRAYLLATPVLAALSLAMCACTKRAADTEPQRSNESAGSAVETLLTGRWHYFSYDIVLSRDRRFEVIAEPGYPGDVHKPATGTWRIAGNKLVQKYDQNGFEEWTIESVTTGNLRMAQSGSTLEFRRVGPFTAPNPDALEAKAREELTAPVASPSPAVAGDERATRDAIARLLIGEWGDANNTVFRYNSDHSLFYSNNQFPSRRYNNAGTWRLEGDRLVHVLAGNETEVRRIDSITADKMVATEGTMTWELAHLTAVAGADVGALAALERAAADQLAAARTSQQSAVAAQALPSLTPRLTRDPVARSTPTPPPPQEPSSAPEGPSDTVISEKLKFLGMAGKQYKRGAPLVSTGGQIPIGTTLYPIRITELAAAGSTVSDLYLFQDEFGEWKCLWRQINRVF